MEIRFLGQPFRDAGQIGEELAQALADEGAQRFWVATAWAKRSGLARVAESITAFRERGGAAEAVIGIDEGGATIEGLELALETFDRTFVFHDVGPRTFHPKLYVVEREDTAVAIVGSGNLTKGGLFTNYEAAIVARLGAADGDRRLLEEIRTYYESLKSTGAACQELTPELLGRLSEVAYITSEATQNRRRVRGAQHEAGQDGRLFGAAVAGLASAPAAQVTPVEGDEQDEDTPFSAPSAAEIAEPEDEQPEEEAEPAETSEPEDDTELAASWWKRLPASDAQHPPLPESSPTGNLRLSRAGHPIDWRTYFRREFFGGLNWAPSGGGKEETTVPFHVTIDGVDEGMHDLRIDHAPHREAGQNNVPTVLHWGTLSPTLRATDYTGYYVILSRTFGGDYRLEISRTAPA